MSLLATDGVFISGTSFQVIDWKGVQNKEQELDYDIYSELEADNDNDPLHPDAFEELYGYRRKAGAPRSLDPNFLAMRDGRLGGAKGGGKDARGDKTSKTSKIKSLKSMMEEVTIQDLLDQGFFQAGQNNITIKCKNKVHTASLNENGEISYEGKLFRDPGDFSHFIKNQGGSQRPGGNGWHCIFVEGVRLQEWRARLLGDPGTTHSIRSSGGSFVSK